MLKNFHKKKAQIFNNKKRQFLYPQTSANKVETFLQNAQALEKLQNRKQSSNDPEQNPEVKPRLPIDAVLMQERYQQSALAPGIALYDEHIRAYYRSRTGGNKDSCWSEEMKALVGKESRPHMRSFLQSKGFTME